MTLFRIASREHPPDNSEGARLYGGRWNKPGTPVLYAAGSRALAAVEVISHTLAYFTITGDRIDPRLHRS